MDITVSRHIDELAERIANDPEQRPLRALIDNAGIEIGAPVEVLPLNLWREQFEADLFGRIAVIQAFLPFPGQSRGRTPDQVDAGSSPHLQADGHCRRARSPTAWRSSRQAPPAAWTAMPLPTVMR